RGGRSQTILRNAFRSIFVERPPRPLHQGGFAAFSGRRVHPSSRGGDYASPTNKRPISMIFLNDNHEVRSGWKFAAYVAFLLLIWVASGTALSMVIVRSDSGLLENQLALFWLNELASFIPAVL